MTSTDQQRSRRAVRSYVLRSGRMTAGQQEALQRYWPAYGLDVADGPLDCAAAYGRDAPVVLEIGFGMGASLLQMASLRPDTNYLGVEVHGPGVGRLLMQCAERRLDNLRVYRADAIEVLQHCIADASLAGVQLYFPDPWPKKKHHKRRIVQPAFAALVAKKLAAGGFFHLATDWENYAEHMQAVMEREPAFDNSAGAGNFSPRPAWRPETRFERRGEALGHGVWDLLYTRRASPNPQI